jgi:hypothetical protein
LKPRRESVGQLRFDDGVQFIFRHVHAPLF